MEAGSEVLCVVYAQGILDSIAKYYLSGLTNRELRSAISFRDILLSTSIRQIAQSYEKRISYETEIIKRAKNVIVENHWAEAYYKKMCSEVCVHFCPISISNSFFDFKWCEESMQPYTIMCPAANYPIKGLHMLLKALYLVKQKYPNVVLYIPGMIKKNKKSIKERLKQSGYDKFIQKLISNLGLEGNVCFMGRLTADEMAKKMSSVNCFAMTSAIENHSSTLKEAMTVGTPCVSSYVGGVPEYAVDNKNCLLHRYEDYEMLSFNICRLFSDKNLRNKLSKNAVDDMRKSKEETDYSVMMKILNDICNK